MKQEIEYKFCLDCGGELAVQTENMLKCTQCGFAYYLNCRPCVGLVLRYEDKIGLCVRAIEPAIGKYDVIGGFLDYTENLEEAIVREAKEETGIDVDISKVRYIGSCNVEYAYGGYVVRPISANFEYPIDDISQISPNDDISAVKFFEFDEIPFGDLAFPPLESHLRSVYAKDALDKGESGVIISK